MAFRFVYGVGERGWMKVAGAAPGKASQTPLPMRSLAPQSGG